MSLSKALAATALCASAALSLMLAATLSSSVPANAQSIYGDTQLSYMNGVVYDDDLVPGRAPNQPYLVGEQESGGSFGGSRASMSSEVRRSVRSIPRNSRNLIGRDGKSSRK
ncbi:MAG: hypothetical protein AAF762_04530 [Pseudomonadota bacterium]